ncbi:unnamed protein product [Albugo candida]|uniref:Uncharacterized protein n=1 Tax=Albugo candida TaxID=65357 RepID=A0A024G5T4_9STRA|nr:unnamed protein product [Albugo candida]|eukprot:CCI42022.1 unnamed protein product [Albugo candida]
MVLKCFLIGILPLVTSAKIKWDLANTQEIFNDASTNRFLKPFLSKEDIDVEADYPGRLIDDYVIVALDHTVINGSFEDAVLAKQIGRGQFYFGSDDVSAVFEFEEEKINSGIARGLCIKENVELAEVVLKLHAIFKGRKDSRVAFSKDERRSL